MILVTHICNDIFFTQILMSTHTVACEHTRSHTHTHTYTHTHVLTRIPTG